MSMTVARLKPWSLEQGWGLSISDKEIHVMQGGFTHAC